MLSIEQNQAADKNINEAVEAFTDAASGGLNVMQLAMNPSGAMEKFGGPLMQLVQGLQAKNEVVNELLYQVQTMQKELEALSNG